MFRLFVETIPLVVASEKGCSLNLRKSKLESEARFFETFPLMKGGKAKMFFKRLWDINIHFLLNEIKFRLLVKRFGIICQRR